MTKRFEDLIRPAVIRRARAPDGEGFGRELVQDQERAEEELPKLVSASGLHMWRPGDPILQRGRRTLVGVGAWSREDLRLLDALAEAAASGGSGGDRIDVFLFWRECKNQEQLERFVPGMDISSIFHSPVVGVWEDGALRQCASGAEGRDLLLAMYGLRASAQDGRWGRVPR